MLVRLKNVVGEMGPDHIVTSVVEHVSINAAKRACRGEPSRVSLKTPTVGQNPLLPGIPRTARLAPTTRRAARRQEIRYGKS